MSNSDYCFFHDPKHTRKRKQASRVGGYHRRIAANARAFPDTNVSTIKGMVAFMETLIRETYQSGFSGSRLRALSSMMQVQKDLVQLRDLDDQCAAMERANRREQDRL